MKILIPLVIGLILIGGSFSSCKYQGTTPPDTIHKCDTCCDTCHKPPCDTCNINQDSLQHVKDSLAHVFEWKEYSNPGDFDNHWSSVWVFGEKDIILMGDRLWHFDGSNFIKINAHNSTTGTLMNAGLSGCKIFALSKTDFWVTSYGGAAFHTTDGAYFTDNRFGPVNACWGTSSNDIFFAGNDGHIFHYDGTTFSEMVSNTTKNIQSVWGKSNKNVWAAGFNPSTAESVLLHYDGISWSSIDLHILGDIGPFHHALNEVWGCDSLGHSITVTGGSLLWRQTDNNSWRSDSGKMLNRLNDGSFIGLYHIRGNNSDDFVATGDGGFISHWNGKTWFRYDNLYNDGNPLYITNAVSMKGNTVCVVGAKNGQPWMVVGTRKQ
jgi:hypothetical protein